MPFGPTNTPTTFQSLMIEDCIVVFDDILVYSLTLENHKFHLAQVLGLLKEASVVCQLQEMRVQEKSSGLSRAHFSIRGGNQSE